MKHFFKNYLFWWLQVVFMSDSDDYSYVERCFNGAVSVLPLPLCEMVLIKKNYSIVSISMKFLFYSNYFLVVVVFPSVIW